MPTARGEFFGRAIACSLMNCMLVVLTHDTLALLILCLIFSDPVGTIERTYTMGNAQAPIAASFSSPGPNLVTPEILKVIPSARNLYEVTSCILALARVH